MSTGGSMLRWSALLGAAALILHELQYRASFGPDAGEALAAHGHAYLSWAIAALSVLGALAVIRLATQVRDARIGASRGRSRSGSSLPHRWAASSAALAAIHLLQEGLEGLLATGHPGIVHAITQHRGWLALPLAVALGLVIALLMRGAEAILERAAGTARASRHPRPRRSTPHPLVRLPAARLPVLAEHLAGRAPPVAS